MVFISTKIEARCSRLHGYGVFAREPIEQGEILERCHCFRMPRDHYHRIEFVNPDFACYLYSWPKFDGDQAAVLFGFGSLYNHSDTPNADWDSELESGTYVFTAARDIHQDEEICISYGDRWWEVRKGSAADVEKIEHEQTGKRRER